jgi:UDP-N-acetylmuramoylalanine--D-glutamate ligase
MDLFFALCRAKIIGVTGSNGKSTTTALIAHILERCLSASGRAVHLGGNIGRSLLLEAANIPESDLVVLELSSFQLEDLGALDVSPWGAVVTNLSPNHLDRHKTLEAYAAAKRNITRFQGEGDFLVLNAADPALAGWEETPAEVLYFGEGETAGRKGVFISGGSLVSTCGDETEKVKIPDDWPLVGRHNLENLAAACTAVSRAGVSLAEALSVASCFRALPHRLEKIGELRGVAFYDDSIATTPESAEAALGSFDGGVVLIAGGYDKGVDLSAFAAAAAGRVRSLVVMGQTSGQIAGAALAANRDLAVVRAANLAEAVEAAYEAASPGDAVVLSPACASYDMFANFRERGTAFRGEFERMVGIKGGGAR